jgi:YbbR domain-containing protein
LAVVDFAYVRTVALENANLKLLSFACALALYAWVHGSQEAQRSIDINIDTLPTGPSSRVLTTPIPPTLRVTVSGPKTAVDDLRAENIRPIQLDLQGGNETRVTFDPSIVSVPPGVKVEQIDPPTIDLVWEDVVVRDIPVEVGVVGTPAQGYVVKGAPVADPKIVRARGPKSEVMVIQRVRAEAFDVTGLTEGKYPRQLSVDRPRGRVTYEAQSVSATVEIGREVVERPFTRVPVAVIGHASARAQPAEVDVRLTCPSEVVRALRPEQIVPRVQPTAAGDHGSEADPVQLAIDSCEVHVMPPSVVVRW